MTHAHIGAWLLPAIGARTSERSREHEIHALVDARARAIGTDRQAYLRFVESAPASELWHLAAAFTNGWTWFFRDYEAILGLAARLRHRRRAVRVWVAGCSSGEELYSVAIALAEAGVDASIVGSDVDTARVEHARRAEYGPIELERVPKAIRARWMDELGEGRARISSELRTRVELSLHNLMREPLPGPWDAIVCRNVLVHCTDAARESIQSRLEAALAPGGTLVLSTAERTPIAAPIALPAPAIKVARPISKPAEPTRDELALRLSSGNRWIAEHRFDRAAQAYRDAEAIDPACAELHFLWGVLHRKQNAWHDAAHALRRALFLDAGLWPARYLLAGVWDRLGERERSRIALRETLEAIEQRPVLAWRSRVDSIDVVARSPSAVRDACLNRLKGG